MVVPALAALAAGLLTLWSTAQHMVLRYDSVFYMSAAESLTRWEWMIDYNGDPLTNFPPGLPIVYRFVMLLGLDSLQAARLVGVAASVLTVILVAYIAHRVGPRGSASLSALVVAVLPAMIAMNTQVMSEPAFAVAVLALVVALVRLPTPPAILTWRNLTPAILASWLCGLIRYQGYAVLLATALVLLLRPHPWKQRLIVIAKYSVPAALVVVFNVLQSSSRADSLGSPMLDARGSTAQDVEVALASFGEWLKLEKGILAAASTEVLGVAVMIMIAASLAYIVWRMRADERFPLLTIVLIFFAALPVVTFASARRVWVEMTPRMVFAFFPLAAIIACVAIVAAVSRIPRPARFVVGALGVVFLLLTGDQTVESAQRIKNYPYGLNTDEQQVPDLGRAVAELDASAIVYSNNTEGLWLSSDGRRILEFDPWVNDIGDLLVDDPADPTSPKYVDRQWRFSRHLCDGLYLAETEWRHPRRPSGSLRRLADIASVEVVQEFDGGTLYFLESSSSDLCTRVEQHFAKSD